MIGPRFMRDLTIMLIVAAVVGAIIGVIALTIFLAWPARAQDLDQLRALQEERATWFRSLKQPESGMSCCDVSDCRRTAWDRKGDQWFAEIEGNMTPIPDKKVLQDKPSIDGDAYVCAGPRGTIYCFVPPSMAM